MEALLSKEGGSEEKVSSSACHYRPEALSTKVWVSDGGGGGGCKELQAVSSTVFPWNLAPEGNAISSTAPKLHEFQVYCFPKRN